MDLTEYKKALTLGQKIPIVTNIDTGNLYGYGPYFNDLWMYSYPTVPTAPTTAVVCDRTTVGALNNQLNNSTGASNKLFCVGGSIGDKHWDYPGFMLIDRLSHQAGLVVTTSSAQTTNLPTAALTRYTDGVGVMMGLSIYTGLRGSFFTSSVTVSYTNQAGTSGRTSISQIFPRDNVTNKIGAFYILPLQQGDYGVRSVESVTLASTGTSGNFGVVLFKPLTIVGRKNITNFGQANFLDGKMLGSLPEIQDDACLSIFGVVPHSNGLGTGNSTNFEIGSRCIFNFYETSVV
jgi:hypothetical protein